MLKEQAVSALGKQSLLMPAWVKSALNANDRLKLYLTLLQSAAQHANAPTTALSDFGTELAQAGLQGSTWPIELIKTAYIDGDTLVLPQLNQLLDALMADITIMARPVCETDRTVPLNITARRDHWIKQFEQMKDDEGLTRESMTALTQGNRKEGDSFHLLVMDLHKQLNAMASEIATEIVDDANVWQIEDGDRPLIQAFMRGLHRTAPLKFSHPGLDTAATRDGARLLIQNDIGTNDAHVLVIEVEQDTVSMTYSDLHVERFEFFKGMLEEIGFIWTVSTPVQSDVLNSGKPYRVGTAIFKAQGQDLLNGLEAAASRIVFVIDWNRARKRLRHFVNKNQAYLILQRAAKEEWGHMAWLLAGGEQLVFNAMQAVDTEAFRIGDRLDEVLGESVATTFLLELMRMCSSILRQQQPVALVADEARMLLARALQQRTFGFDLLAEHAAYCHTLAMALCDVLENGQYTEVTQINDVVSRAKTWERQADHQLMDARQRAERHGQWLPLVDLLERSDDVADALEEAIFIYSMTLIEPLKGLPSEVKQALLLLANTTLAAIQDLIKAIEIARHINVLGEPIDSDLFLQALWRMLRAERVCDDLSRQARMTIVRSLQSSAAAYSLASDLANVIEKASDHLLAAGYALRKMVFTKTGISS
ncbi:DUF47 family protein [Undibacterium sp. SXout11W]|uniref:DUF47 family protein n=1 Tax=Undibacterium sp. SXout11W TaxID=3413050 RepID=UPI003BF054AD